MTCSVSSSSFDRQVSQGRCNQRTIVSSTAEGDVLNATFACGSDGTW